jgi:hypothetical protein
MGRPLHLDLSPPMFELLWPRRKSRKKSFQNEKKFIEDKNFFMECNGAMYH